MKPRFFLLAACAAMPLNLLSADGIVTRSTYEQRYGKTKGSVVIDAAKELPRYPAVEPAQAVASWQVKPGYQLELAAHEPLVRDPIALSFDEQGHLFACEMIDYSEMRDVTPHLGRVSMLTDSDSDGRYDKASIYADDLPWPTALLCANGGIFVAATPDLWFFKDTDGDGKADLRERIYTGFGTGLKVLNVQGMANCLQWHLDCRIHMQCGGGNRGKVHCLKRPELPAQEIGGRDFWFDPRSLEFGFDDVGAQYGMSYDTQGRKFACANSDHLQFYPYASQYAERNPHFTLPAPRRSVAADGPAAEVFRVSPDEPWRIIRTRLRVSGVLKGAVEGGGRVSGYFTGATGTTIYRGDACPEWVNHSFTGDAGGQLIHHKTLRADGISVIGQRPADELKSELAASRDTWVRVVNFANAPDGHLHVCDMYREIIEHPWSIGDEIKQHLDLNSGNDRGRIYRLAKTGQAVRRTNAGIGEKPLATMSIAELVTTLSHANGWHRDCAARLLCERADSTSIPALRALMGGQSHWAKLHALGVLKVMNALDATMLLAAVSDDSPAVREHGLRLLEQAGPLSDELAFQLKTLARDKEPRVLMQLAFTLPALQPHAADSVASQMLAEARKRLAAQARQQPFLADALASAPPAWCIQLCLESLPDATEKDQLLQRLLGVLGAVNERSAIAQAMQTLPSLKGSASLIKALAQGLTRAGSSISTADPEGKLRPLFTQARSILADSSAALPDRLEAAELLALNPTAEAQTALLSTLGATHTEHLQVKTISLLSPQLGADLLHSWPGLKPAAKTELLTQLCSSKSKALALLESVGKSNMPVPGDFSATQLQNLLQSKDSAVSTAARKTLATVIPASRAEVLAQFQACLQLKGDSAKGQQQFMARCFACHQAKGQGMNVGPDLVTVKARGAAGILEAVLHPNKEVAPQYIACTVSARDGRQIAGIITRDDSSGMTLRMMGGLEQALARADIKGTSSTGTSLMPEGLEQGMSQQDMADLLAFIEGL